MCLFACSYLTRWISIFYSQLASIDYGLHFFFVVVFLFSFYYTHCVLLGFLFICLVIVAFYFALTGGVSFAIQFRR